MAKSTAQKEAAELWRREQIMKTISRLIGVGVRRLALRLQRWEAKRLAARVEEDSYRMYCMGYPKGGRITIMEEARRFEKWAEHRFSENTKDLARGDGAGIQTGAQSASDASDCSGLAD